MVQATETVKLLLGKGEPLIGRLLTYDALGMRFREVRLRRDPKCPLCGEAPVIRDLSIHASGRRGLRAPDGRPRARRRRGDAGGALARARRPSARGARRRRVLLREAADGDGQVLRLTVPPERQPHRSSRPARSR